MGIRILMFIMLSYSQNTPDLTTTLLQIVMLSSRALSLLLLASRAILLSDTQKGAGALNHRRFSRSAENNERALSMKIMTILGSPKGNGNTAK